MGLSVVKQNKVQQLEISYRRTLAAGITVGGITLAATEQDQNTFTRLAVLLNTQVLSLAGDALAHFSHHSKPLSTRGERRM